MWLVLIEKMNVPCLTHNRGTISVRFLLLVHQHLLGRSRDALQITSLGRVLQLYQLWICNHSAQWTLLPDAQSHIVERTQAVLGPDTQNSHLAKSVSHDPSAQHRQSCGDLPRPFLGNDLTFLQPDILDFCALVPTLVKGWTAPLRDLNYFTPTLSSQPGITPKQIDFFNYIYFTESFISLSQQKWVDRILQWFLTVLRISPNFL